MRRSGREVDEAFISDFPLPVLDAVRDWLTAIDFEAKMSTAHSDMHGTSKRIIASRRRRSDTQELNVFLSTHIERPTTNDEATKLITKVGPEIHLPRPRANDRA